MKGGIPKEAPSPTCPESAFRRDAGRGSLPRDGSQLRTLPCGPGFREARACGERGHLPGRAVPPPLGALLPSTLKTAQKEIWSTKVNSEPHGPRPAFPLRAVLFHTVSRGAQECGTLSSPGVFSLPFPRFKLHSSLRLAHNYLIVPHLLENHIRPPPGSSPNPSYSRLAESISLAVSSSPQVHSSPLSATCCPRLPARSVLTSLAMQIYAALLPVPHSFPAQLIFNVSLLPALLSADYTPNCLRPSLPAWWEQSWLAEGTGKPPGPLLRDGAGRRRRGRSQGHRQRLEIDPAAS